MSDPIELAASLAERLPTADLRKLSAAAAGGLKEVRGLRMTVPSNVLRHACDQVVACLETHSGLYVAGALAAAAAITAKARDTQTVDVVWTQPYSTVTTSRLTADTVISLIGEAQEEIWLVSYAVHPERDIERALSEAAARNVKITLLLERHEDNDAYRSRGEPFASVQATRLAWPASRRRTGYTSMHAKILLVDSHTALVGSANLTSAAMEANLECGILLHGGPHPAAIRAHLTALRAQGDLVRL
jgi:phosphatidylserine/phosphatidylglycerophosphate/cardiolipin synthase-like enzyme